MVLDGFALLLRFAFLFVFLHFYSKITGLSILHNNGNYKVFTVTLLRSTAGKLSFCIVTILYKPNKKTARKISLVNKVRSRKNSIR